jgi:hypothetical protein
MVANGLRAPVTRIHSDAHALCLSPRAWFGITFATFWIALLAHEGAHFGVAHVVYSRTELATGRVSPFDQLLVVGAGPAFTLAMIVACAVVTPRLRRAAAVGIAAIAFGVSRILVISPATLLNRGPTDERTVAQLTNTSPRLLWSVEALVAIAAVAFVARSTPMPRRRRSVLWIALGTVAGWVSALTLGRAIGLPI